MGVLSQDDLVRFETLMEEVATSGPQKVFPHCETHVSGTAEKSRKLLTLPYGFGDGGAETHILPDLAIDAKLAVLAHEAARGSGEGKAQL